MEGFGKEKIFDLFSDWDVFGVDVGFWEVFGVATQVFCGWVELGRCEVDLLFCVVMGFVVAAFWGLLEKMLTAEDAPEFEGDS